MRACTIVTLRRLLGARATAARGGLQCGGAKSIRFYWAESRFWPIRSHEVTPRARAARRIWATQGGPQASYRCLRSAGTSARRPRPTEPGGARHHRPLHSAAVDRASAAAEPAAGRAAAAVAAPHRSSPACRAAPRLWWPSRVHDRLRLAAAGARSDRTRASDTSSVRQACRTCAWRTSARSRCCPSDRRAAPRTSSGPGRPALQVNMYDKNATWAL